MKILSIAALGAALVLSAGAASAAGPHTRRVEHREARQQRRIEHGVEHRRLSPTEERRLEAREAAIRKQEERMRAEGRLNERERRKLERELSGIGRRIRAEKHRA